MQPPAGPSLPPPSDRANVGHSVLTSNQLQVNRSILRFSLTHEIFPDSRGPASTSDNRGRGSAVHSRGNSDFAGDSNARPAIYPLRCRFCESKLPSKTALLGHVQEHSRDIRRENELLLEELLSGMEALGPGIRLASSTIPYGQDRRADATTEPAQVRQRPVAGPSCHRPGQMVQQTDVTSSSDNVLVPASRSSPPSLVLMDYYAQRAEQTRQGQTLINQSRDVALQLSSTQAHLQNLASTSTQSCSTAPRKVCAAQRPALRPIAPKPTFNIVPRALPQSGVGGVEYRSQSQPAKPNNEAARPQTTTSDSAHTIERLAVAQVILSPLKQFFYTGNYLPPGFSGSDAVRPSAEVPGTGGTTSEIINPVINLNPAPGAPASLPCVTMQGFCLQVENTSVRTCSSDPSPPENSLAAPLKPTQGADRRCTSGEMTTHDNVTSQLLATQCNESRQYEPASTGAVARTGQQSSEGGVLAVSISTNHDPEDRRSAVDESTTSDGGLVQHREPEAQQDSTQEATPCLSFSLNLVQDSDAFEQQVTKQGDDTVQVSCGLGVVKEEIPEVSACENAGKPPSAPRTENLMPDRDLVIDESSGHLSDVRARGVKRDRGISCDPVADEAATDQRSAGATEDASTPDTPRKKRVKTSWQPLRYDPKDKSGPSTAKASRGTERQESEQGTTMSASGQGTRQPNRVRATTWYPPR